MIYVFSTLATCVYVHSLHLVAGSMNELSNFHLGHKNVSALDFWTQIMSILFVQRHFQAHSQDLDSSIVEFTFQVLCTADFPKLKL